MRILDKRTPTATKTFCELPVGAVFQIAEFDYYMKIATSDFDDNAVDLEDGSLFHCQNDEEVYILNAHLVVEGEGIR